ncbi:protein ANTAGONIST OF LIKE HETEROCHROMATIN PROTEIN 1-like [Gymnodraco acuticeps]|uniref:Protein ANTAGONIST OF LIKE HETEROCHROMATIN PROTEIN 1-like n=1 Tax=Gymnodraco acuticeps TaxID=8218 RepID=A0A6P8V3B0_GYMAC|nr:protein ANTAGONIST OF LIKE HETEROCHROMATIN PROTEIN 1-like [Gymnodraco acuticeps]
MADCVEALLVLVLLCRNEMEEMGRLYYQLYSRYMLNSKLLYNPKHQRRFRFRRRKKNFRVSRQSFDYICNQVSGVMGRRDTNYRLCIPNKKRVAIALWKLATGGEYRTISHLFGVGQSTVCLCVQDFCWATMEVLLPLHITFPDVEKLVEMATFFNRRWRAPQCVGAIDGSHIPILAPRDYPLGQNKMTISGCDVGHYLIGDPSYPMQRWLMKPFSDTGRLTPEQHTYNYRLSSARSVVEMAFGRRKGRWRCLLKRNDCELELSKIMTVTCCVLHNICEEHSDNFTDDCHELVYDQPALHPLPDNGRQEGADVRSALMDYFNMGDH